MRYLALVFAAALALPAAADTYVKGYFKKDGTYVSGHTRSSPNKYRYDNYGSETNGGTQRDEFSDNGGATNRSNESWGSYDNDADGALNSWDTTPEGESTDWEY